MAEEYYQFNLFDDFPQKPCVVAINCFTREAVPAEEPEHWMLRLIPNGDYAVKIGEHSMVLRRLKSAASKIPAGLEYCHYLINGFLYFGVFVGA